MCRGFFRRRRLTGTIARFIISNNDIDKRYQGGDPMPRKSLGLLTESMLYTMMAFQTGPRCGTEISAYVESLTGGRVQLGPGTLYTILSKFQEVGYLREISVDGRKRTYVLTENGRSAYEQELMRLRQCIRDAASAACGEGGEALDGAGADPALAPLPAL